MNQLIEESTEAGAAGDHQMVYSAWSENLHRAVSVVSMDMFHSVSMTTGSRQGQAGRQKGEDAMQRARAGQLD